MTISSRFWAKVLIFWKFSPNSEFRFLFFRKLFLKIFACGAKIHLPNFRMCHHFYLVYRPKTMQNRSQKFSPAAQNEPLLVLRFLFFGKYFGKVSILLKFSSNLESTGSYRGGVLFLSQWYRTDRIKIPPLRLKSDPLWIRGLIFLKISPNSQSQGFNISQIFWRFAPSVSPLKTLKNLEIFVRFAPKWIQKFGRFAPGFYCFEISPKSLSSGYGRRGG